MMESSRLYICMATPEPGVLKTSRSITWPSSPTNFIVSVPLPGNLKSVARYWSPKAWRPMMIGLVQPGTSRGTLRQMMGSRNTTPPRMLRMVPLGDFHISFRPNSFTRPSSGVMVAHLTPTPTFLMALAASTVTWSLVLSRYSIPRSKYIRSISRNGRTSLSLMYCQMIRVISSPSSSTTGLVTLIFAIEVGPFESVCWGGGNEPFPIRPYSIAATRVEGEWLGSAVWQTCLWAGLEAGPAGLAQKRLDQRLGKNSGAAKQAAPAGALGRERHQRQRDQPIDDDPDQDLVGDALGQPRRGHGQSAAENR